MKNKLPAPHETHPISTMPSEDEDDRHANLEAARHREHASTIVRNHLENHAANNPGASSDYVTWIATLHPENADITIDQRFFVPGMSHSALLSESWCWFRSWNEATLQYSFRSWNETTRSLTVLALCFFCIYCADFRQGTHGGPFTKILRTKKFHWLQPYQ